MNFEGLEPYQINMFMVNTLAFQLEKWAVIPENAPLTKESREAIKHLRNKCRKLIEINQIRPLSDLEETFYEVGDEFHALMGYIQMVTGEDAQLGFNLFEVCVAIAIDDKAYLREFFLSATSLFCEAGSVGMESVVQMYCPEMEKAKREAFVKLLKSAK